MNKYIFLFIIGCSKVNEASSFKKNIEAESEIKDLDWYSNDCNIQKLNLYRAVDYSRKGLITDDEYRLIWNHTAMICGDFWWFY